VARLSQGPPYLVRQGKEEGVHFLELGNHLFGMFVEKRHLAIGIDDIGYAFEGMRSEVAEPVVPRVTSEAARHRILENVEGDM